MTVDWIDTHAHVNDVQFDADREQVFERALAAGVKTLVEVAESPEMNARKRRKQAADNKSTYY